MCICFTSAASKSKAQQKRALLLSLNHPPGKRKLSGKTTNVQDGLCKQLVLQRKSKAKGSFSRSLLLDCPGYLLEKFLKGVLKPLSNCTLPGRAAPGCGRRAPELHLCSFISAQRSGDTNQQTQRGFQPPGLQVKSGL